MLTELRLETLKCFEHLSAPLSPLTVLTGENSGGKSTILHALRLVALAMQDDEWGRSITLGSEDLPLGTVADIVNSRIGKNQIGIGVTTESSDAGKGHLFKRHFDWRFSGERHAMSMRIDSVHVDGEEVADKTVLRWLLPLGADATDATHSLRTSGWVTAGRIGPREVLPLVDVCAPRRAGPKGERAAGVFHVHDDHPVLPGLCEPGYPPTLQHQVRAWMRSLFPGCDLQTQPIPFTSAVTLGLKTRDGDNFRRSTNVGFGLTQAFPIFVEVLAASAGDLLLIENPEVHLHPGGQSRMGRFLALAAASGVQIVLETHSDHVLNGIRLAVRSGLVPAERVVFHYLTSKEQQVVLNMVRIEQDGTIRDWPKGFFDQFEEDLAALTGWSDS